MNPWLTYIITFVVLLIICMGSLIWLYNREKRNGVSILVHRWDVRHVRGSDNTGLQSNEGRMK